MRLEHARIVLTGACGGLGRELARELSAAGAKLLLAGRETTRLNDFRAELAGNAAIVCADLTRSEGIALTVRAAQDFAANVLINNAGANAFGLFDEQEWAAIARIFASTLEAPVHLTQALLPWLKAQPQAAIVNIGSAFGALPYPGFVAYSAAKAGLRGFSQALRRELSDTLVSVVHIAPRAIHTPMNSDAVNRLNRALGNRSDSASDVARQIVLALSRNARELNIGFPERLYAWLNGFAPRLVDRALAGQLATVKRHTTTR